MSIQKLKIFKKLKGGDLYNKNPILDSLIKQKLQSEMIIIKDNFNTLIQRSDAKDKQTSPVKPVKRRRLSTHNLESITSDRIKESINFQHQRDKEVLHFVINRQKSSPFIDKSGIEALNTARTNYEDITIKMKESDKIYYELYGVKENQIDQQYHQNLSQRLRQIVPTDIWLTEQPEVQEIITSKAEEFELSPLKLSNALKLSLTNRPSSHSFDPLKGSRHKIQKKQVPEAQSQVTYDPNRYHKSDYSSLQKWFESMLDHVHKKHQKNLSTTNCNYHQELTNHLNGVYTVYISTLKEMIRLTYIQSAQKGLLMEKAIWSFVRLFEELIQAQHKLNYEEFKESSKQLRELRDLYQQRMSKLQKLLQQKQAAISTFSQTKKSIVMSCLTYKKVNAEMVDEIEILMKQIKALHHQNDYLMKNLRKLIDEFEKRQIIKIQKQDNFNIYYFLNQKNAIEVVARVPKEELLEKYFESDMKQTSIHNIQEELAKEISKVNRLQNDLTSFWQKKRNYLEIDKIIEQNFAFGVEDAAVQVDVNGPYEYVNQSTQFPEVNQQAFEDFLKRQIIEQREVWSKKQVQLKEVTISLKQLYDQARESITILSTQNVALKHTIDQKDHEISYLKRKLQQVEEKATLFSKKIAILQKEGQIAKGSETNLMEEVKRGVERLAEEKRKAFFEKENNNILVISNYQLKERLDGSQQLFQQLQRKIKTLAPHLQEMMALAQTSQNALLLKLSSLVETHLSDYVQRDAKVFLTH